MDLIPKKFYLDDIFNDFMPSETDKMKCDIYEQGGDYHIEMDIPGFNKEDISIESDQGYLTVTAERKENKEEEDKNYIRRERKYGKYQRSFYLGDLNNDDIQAEFKDGMLKIVVPKKEIPETKKIIEIK